VVKHLFFELIARLHSTVWTRQKVVGKKSPTREIALGILCLYREGWPVVLIHCRLLMISSTGGGLGRIEAETPVD
jgi:hypothetical protein